MRVVVIGDSHAVGMRKAFQELAARKGFELDMRAKGGTNTGQWAREQNPETRIPELEGAAYLVAILGTNDAGYGGKTFPGNLETILDKASAELVPVIWAEPTGEQFSQYAQIHAALNAAVQDSGIQALVPHPPLPKYGDGVHLDPAGYAAWVDAIWTAVAELEEPPATPPQPKPPWSRPSPVVAVGAPLAVGLSAALTFWALRR